MLLRNFDKGNLYYDIDTNENYTLNFTTGLRGWYKSVQGIISGILVEKNKLFLYLDGTKYEVTDDITVKLSAVINDGNKRNAEIYKLENRLASFQYELNEDYSNYSPFEYMDEEEFDWGLFLKNIINNLERKKTFIENIEIE